MKKPKLIEIFSSGGDKNNKVRLQYDNKTGELYVNDKKVVTEVDFSKSEKILAWLVAISVATQAVMSIFTYFKMP